MKYISLITVVFVMILNSCTKDFLDVPNTSQLYRETYVKDLITLREYLRGAYFRFYTNVEAGETTMAYPEVAADNIRPLSITSSQATISHYNWVQEAVPSAIRNMTGLWRESYSAIRNLSFVIRTVDKYRSENEAEADAIKGEALAMRALLHSKLVNVFAQPYGYTNDASHIGIPYIATDDITQPYSRQSVEEVYNAMISDLDAAISLLPAATGDIRLMNRRAAKALLARIYLFKNDYAKAKTLAIEVLNEVPLMTIAGGYPVDIFKWKGQSVTETLFQTTSGTSNAFGRWLRRAPISLVATNDLAMLLLESTSDIRSSWVKDTIVAGNHHWLVKKFPTGVTPENPNVSSVDVAYNAPIIRSSEMFLTAAEAAAKTNDEDAARTYLNAVRKRADPSRPDLTTGGDALLDSIYKERRKELAFEGIRLFDLLRLKKDVVRTEVLPGSPAVLPYPNDKAIAPLPLDEIRIGNLPQNAGYN